MRNHKSAFTYMCYFAIAILAVFLCTISGCSNQDRSEGTSVETAPVTFVFDLFAPAKGEVPVAVTHFGFFGYSDTDCKTPIYYKEVVKDQTEGVEQQEITLNVPVQVVIIRICYYDQDDNVLMESITDPLNLTAGHAQTINVSETIEPQGANLVLHFAEDVVIPDTSTKCQVNMYDAEGNLACTCAEEVDSEALQDITIAAVPVNVTAIDLLWQNSEGVTCGIHELSGSAIPELAIGKTSTVTVVGAANVETSDLALTITNAYNDNNLTAANVQVVYRSESAAKRTTAGPGTLSGTTCTAAFKGLVGKDVEVLSVTLCNAATKVPFEWLDYETAQAVKNGRLTLNVEDNEFANGKYAEGNIMLIANPRQFRNIDDHLGGSYMQIKDVDFAGACGITMDKDGNVTSTDDTARYYNGDQGYKPIAAIEENPFTGTYDGGTYTDNGEEQHYAISGVVINCTVSHTALFGFGRNCIFKNVNIDDTCFIKATGSEGTDLECISSLVAQLDGESGSSLEKCTSKAKIFGVKNETSYFECVGGLVGYCGSYAFGSEAVVDCKDCSFEGSISAPEADNVGMVGVATLINGTFINCANYGTITCNGSCGGIVGNFSHNESAGEPVLFENCSNSGAISISAKDVGGIVGEVNSGSASVVSCSNSGAIQANSIVGGIVGYVYTGSVHVGGCSNSGTLQANSNEGGMVGFVYSGSLSVVNCSNSGTIQAEKYLGGIVGIISGGKSSLSIENCRSTGAIEATQESGQLSAGGLVGSSGALTEKAFTITGTNTVDCPFTYSKAANTLGGGLGYSSKIVADDLKAKLQGHVKVTDKCAKTITSDSEKKVGKYCGNPWVDSLE